MNWGGIAATALGGAVKDLRSVLNLFCRLMNYMNVTVFSTRICDKLLISNLVFNFI